VKGWNEDARIDFIGELSTGRWISSEAVVDFALADPSPKVRAAAVSMLSWCGADQDLARLLKDLDEESFEEAVREIPLESIPILLQPRALTVYRKLLNESTDVMNCIRILLRLAKLGDTNIPEKLKYELTRLPSDRINDQAEYVIRPALEVVRKTEPEWASHWVVGRIAGGSLRQKDWMTFVSSIPENLKAELLAGIGSKELQYNRLSDIIAAQAAIGDFSLVDAVFTKLCDARRDISDDARAQDQAKWAIVRQLEDILQSLPPDLAVASLSNCFTREFDVVEFIAVIKVFGGFDSNAPDLRDRLQDDLRQNLRTYLKNGVRFALKQDDPSGEMKAHLATALARVGEPEDMLDLRQLIRADIERIRNGISARARGEQSALAKWCQNMYDNWYVRAIAVLDTKQAGAVLMELLLEPEYENMAASALVRLAIIRNTENQFRHGTDYRIVWDARAGRRPNQFDEESRCLYATAIKQRIYSLLNEREYSIQTAFYNFRLKELARVLAKLDSHNSAELVLQIIALPGEWDGWHRVEALEALLLNGAELPAEETLRALNPVIEQVCADGLYNNQNVRLVTRCLCLLPFINVPSIGIGRMRQVLSSARIPPHELREMITALGQSRCQEALTLLRELAGTSEIDMQYIFGEWISAVAILGVPESERILLGFIDPDVDGFDIGTEKGRNGKNEVLVSCIADLAQRKFEIKQRLFRLCEIQRSPTVRIMLSKVIFRLGAVDAILAGLNLIDDNATPPIPYDLRRAIENFFLERYPQVKTENDHTLLRQGSIEIREKLFEMTLREVRRKKSAIALLGQIEVWRLEYGKPVAEPRHPAFDSGELWPPIQMTGAINCDV